MKKFFAFLLLSLLLCTACGRGETAGTEASGEKEVLSDAVIQAPYSIDEKGPSEYLEPVFYENENGPDIGVTLTNVIRQNGLYFKDSDNDGELDDFEDWRLSAEDRAEDLLGKMTAKQRLGLTVNQLTMQPDIESEEEAYDENGNVIFENLIHVTENAMNAVFVEGEDSSNSTGEILTCESRSGVLRKVLDGTVSSLWVNSLNMVCEYDAAVSGNPSIPFTVISNPQNEITDAPSSQGFAAAVMGDVAAGGDYSLIEEFSDIDREVWYAKGISRMYGPQIDLITDPRWPRNNTTYTEVPEVCSGIAEALVKGYQGESLTSGSTALIVKHFPGDGASYNGFESHNAIGKYRVYETEGSLEKYQLPGFQAAIDAGCAGIMPGYSVQTTDGELGTVLQTYAGTEITDDGLANAYSSEILDTLLRDACGFEGLVNTDSGVLNGGREYGAEEETEVERFASLLNAGCDVISNRMYGLEWNTAWQAWNDGLIEEETLDRANRNTLIVMFEQGLFENPYKNVEESAKVVEEKTEELQEKADDVNLKSVVLLKNSGNVLPLSDSGSVYVECFSAEKNVFEEDPQEWQNVWEAAFEAEGFSVVSSPEEADFVFFDVVPGGVSTSNNYVNVLDLVENRKVKTVDFPDSAEYTGGTTFVTTLKNVDRIQKIAETVHGNGGFVLASIDLSHPWILTNLEPFCDGLIASYSTSKEARMDVLTGRYAPTGKLPVSLPSCEEVLSLSEAEDKNGNFYEACASPNDVPGYDKDSYMSQEVLAQSPSGSYVYQDTDGNFYQSWWGLSY